jgi:hypothetical protein
MRYNLLDFSKKVRVGYIFIAGIVFPIISKTNFNKDDTFNTFKILSEEYDEFYTIRDYVPNILKYYGKICTELDPVAIRLNMPIFIIIDDQYKNKYYALQDRTPVLRNMGLQNYLTAEKVGSMVEHYVDSILNNENDRLITLSDDVKLCKHGFNKNSFRRRKAT